MKIVSKQEMRTYPRGTVFADYHNDRGMELESLEVKDDYEFGATSLMPDEYGEVFDWDWNIHDYEDSDYFYIFEEKEILCMIKTLMRGIGYDDER